MTIALPPGLAQFVDHLVASGRYVDEGEVIREALRAFEKHESESPALESALLEGVRSPHRPYDASVLNDIRQAAIGG